MRQVFHGETLPLKTVKLSPWGCSQDGETLPLIIERKIVSCSWRLLSSGKPPRLFAIWRTAAAAPVLPAKTFL
jgi:hypothetical protein